MTVYQYFGIGKDRGIIGSTASTYLGAFTGVSGATGRTVDLLNTPVLGVSSILKQGAPLTETADYTISSNTIIFIVDVTDGEYIEINYTYGSATPTMVSTYYAVPTDVQRIIQRSTAFSSTSTPTDEMVALTINRWEDYVDQVTQHSWRTKTITNELYDIPEIPYNYSTGLPIHLRHRMIKTLSAVSNDKLEVWTGSAWEDWLASREEGRNKDYWLDEEQGTLFIRNPLAYHTKKSIRLTYRYGDTTIPAPIRDAVALYTAAEIIESNDQTMVLAETGDSTRMNYDGRVNSWRKKADKLIEPYKEMFIW